jgi:hypothetical protein
MSHKKKNSVLSNDKELYYEVEIMKVKLDQLEKRFDLLEKTLSFFERTHRAEIETIFNQIKNNSRSETSDSESESETDTTSTEPISDTEIQNNIKKETISKRISSLRRVT